MLLANRKVIQYKAILDFLVSQFAMNYDILFLKLTTAQDVPTIK